MHPKRLKWIKCNIKYSISFSSFLITLDCIYVSTLYIFVQLCALGYGVHNWNVWGQFERIHYQSETFRATAKEDKNSGTKVAVLEYSLGLRLRMLRTHPPRTAVNTGSVHWCTQEPDIGVHF